MIQFYVIYPERKLVSEDKIRVWYADGVANNEVEPIDSDDVYEMARALDDAGHITLGRTRNVEYQSSSHNS